MKVASIIFTVLGIIANFYYSNVILGIIGLIIGIIAIISLCEGKKNIAIGIFDVLFTGLLGGIFYLCWDPNKETKN